MKVIDSPHSEANANYQRKAWKINKNIVRNKQRDYNFIRIEYTFKSTSIIHCFHQFLPSIKHLVFFTSNRNFIKAHIWRDSTYRCTYERYFEPARRL